MWDVSPAAPPVLRPPVEAVEWGITLGTSAFQTFQLQLGTLLLFRFRTGHHDVQQMRSPTALDACDGATLLAEFTTDAGRNLTVVSWLAARPGRCAFACSLPGHCEASGGVSMRLNVTVLNADGSEPQAGAGEEAPPPPTEIVTISWLFNGAQALSAPAGATLRFRYFSTTHDVWQMASAAHAKACNFSGAVLLPSTTEVPTSGYGTAATATAAWALPGGTAPGQTFGFACGKPLHCSASGMKLVVTAAAARPSSPAPPRPPTARAIVLWALPSSGSASLPAVPVAPGERVTFRYAAGMRDVLWLLASPQAAEACDYSGAEFVPPSRENVPMVRGG